MMEFIQPLGIQSVAALYPGIEDANIVEIAFSNDPGLTSQMRGLFMKAVAKLRQHGAGAEVENLVDGIEP